MLCIQIQGRLGNQLFQYAFINEVSRQKQETFFLAKTGDVIDIYKYFKLKATFFYLIDVAFFNHKTKKLLFTHYFRSFFYNSLMKMYIRHFIDEAQYSIDAIASNTCFKGYFQSEKYFKNSRKEILEVFTVKKLYQSAFYKKFESLLKNEIVAVHIRKTDYHDLAHLNLGGSDLSLPLSYYQSVINKLPYDRYTFIFISDEINAIKHAFDFLPHKYFSEECEIFDFQFMQNAHVCIISNSTFSWWAAYLNRKKDKVIYCPKNFLGWRMDREYPRGIYPEGWIQVEVN